MHIKLINNIPEKYSIGQLLHDNQQVSFPRDIPDATLAEYDVYPVQPTDQPNYDPATHRIEEATPALVDGVWTQAWTVRKATDAEVQASKQSIYEQIVLAAQERLDAFARTRNYDNILSACTYANSAVPRFQVDGQYCVQARDATWAKLYEMLGEVEAGTRPMPTGFNDVEPELPALDWPA